MKDPIEVILILYHSINQDLWNNHNFAHAIDVEKHAVIFLWAFRLIFSHDNIQPIFSLNLHKNLRF